MFIFRIISLWNLKREANTLTQMLNLFCRRLPLIISKKKHTNTLSLLVLSLSCMRLFSLIFFHLPCVFFSLNFNSSLTSWFVRSFFLSSRFSLLFFFQAFFRARIEKSIQTHSVIMSQNRFAFLLALSHSLHEPHEKKIILYTHSYCI